MAVAARPPRHPRPQSRPHRLPPWRHPRPQPRPRSVDRPRPRSRPHRLPPLGQPHRRRPWRRPRLSRRLPPRRRHRPTRPTIRPPPCTGCFRSLATLSRTPNRPWPTSCASETPPLSPSSSRRSASSSTSRGRSWPRRRCVRLPDRTSTGSSGTSGWSGTARTASSSLPPTATPPGRPTCCPVSTTAILNCSPTPGTLPGST